MGLFLYWRPWHRRYGGWTHLRAAGSANRGTKPIHAPYGTVGCPLQFVIVLQPRTFPKFQPDKLAFGGYQSSKFEAGRAYCFDG
jgi:hypothetical protein